MQYPGMNKTLCCLTTCTIAMLTAIACNHSIKNKQPEELTVIGMRTPSSTESLNIASSPDQLSSGPDQSSSGRSEVKQSVPAGLLLPDANTSESDRLNEEQAMTDNKHQPRTGSVKSYRNSPETWLNRIKLLGFDGARKEAEEEYKLFREKYPDFQKDFEPIFRDVPLEPEYPFDINTPNK
ncbi:MAG: hypothetical protein KTR32_23575 [Granulosicoccus sp.]|nr:hypothetical protein [Granulosicoccus sp.]